MTYGWAYWARHREVALAAAARRRTPLPLPLQTARKRTRRGTASGLPPEHTASAELSPPVQVVGVSPAGTLLHLSEKSATGYLGVTLHASSGRYRARFGRESRGSWHATALEAAEAYATFAGPPAGGSRPAPLLEQLAETSSSGVQLHKSVRSNTGYLGVTRLDPRRADGSQRRVNQYRMRHGKAVSYHETALAAAEAYAEAAGRFPRPDGAAPAGYGTWDAQEGVWRSLAGEAQPEPIMPARRGSYPANRASGKRARPANRGRVSQQRREVSRRGGGAAQSLTMLLAVSSPAAVAPMASTPRIYLSWLSLQSDGASAPLPPRVPLPFAPPPSVPLCSLSRVSPTLL